MQVENSCSEFKLDCVGELGIQEKVPDASGAEGGRSSAIGAKAVSISP